MEYGVCKHCGDPIHTQSNDRGTYWFSANSKVGTVFCTGNLGAPDVTPGGHEPGVYVPKQVTLTLTPEQAHMIHLALCAHAATVGNDGDEAQEDVLWDLAQLVEDQLNTQGVCLPVKGAGA